jgi:hypothetical protein
MKALLVAIALCVSVSANAATATFTGRAKQVQTVTYQMAWQCEYQYGGKYFYVLESEYCTSTVEVQ